MHDAPVYFGDEESHFAVGAHAVATTGRNLNGDKWPLFFNLADPAGDPRQMPWGDTWYHPMLFYLIALVLQIVPLSEAAVRMPMAVIGCILTPVLIYRAARGFRLDVLSSIVAALVIATAPAHVILNRQAVDFALPVPFVAAWLWCLSRYQETRDVRTALILGAVLGAGCYSYIAAWTMMPFLLGVSWAEFWMRTGGRRAVVASIGGFAPAVIVVAAWLSAQPAALTETIRRYQILESHRPPQDQSRLANVGAAAPIYLSYADPRFLFGVGGSSLTASTGRVGVFLLPVMILLPTGLYAISRREHRERAWPIVAGLVFAPLPAAMSGHAGAIQRATLLLPFVAIVSGYGFRALWQSRQPAIRWSVVAVAAVAPIQFAAFSYDYFTLYRQRSAFSYDAVAFAAVADHLMAVPDPPAIYLRRSLDAPGAKWRFYLTKAGRLPLLERTHYIDDAAEAELAAVESRLVMYVEEEVIARLQRDGRWVVEAIVHDVDQRPAAAVLRKLR